MNNQNSYIQLLVNNSRNGRTNSFLELSELFHEKIFQLQFQLSGNKQAAFNLTVETFLTAKNNLTQLSDKVSFENWIKQIAIILGYSKSISNVEQEKQINFEGIELNAIEQEFLTLPLKNRVILMLHDQLEYNFSEIKESVNIESVAEIKQQLNWSKRILAEKSRYEKIKKLNESIWSDFAEAFEADRNSTGGEVAPELFSAYLDFKAFNMDLQNIFSNLEIPDKITSALKNRIMEDSEKRKSRESLQTNEIQINKFITKDSGRSFKLELDTTKEKTNIIKRIIKPAAVLGSLMLLTFVFTKIILNHSNEPWILSQENNVLVNNIQSRGELFKGDKIVSSRTGNGKIKIDNIGYFTFGSESEFKILNAENEDNSIKVTKGEFGINLIPKKNIKDKYSDEFYFNIYCGNFQFHSGPLEANISINQNGKVDINCIDGWVNYQTGMKEFYIGKGFEYFNDSSSISPVPFRKKSSVDFRNILFEIDPTNLSIKMLSELLLEAEKKDALSLLNLLQFLSQRERELVVNRLIENDKFFSFLGKENLISIDKNVMKMAFDYLKWELISSQ